MHYVFTCLINLQFVFYLRHYPLILITLILPEDSLLLLSLLFYVNNSNNNKNNNNCMRYFNILFCVYIYYFSIFEIP